MKPLFVLFLAATALVVWWALGMRRDDPVEIEPEPAASTLAERDAHVALDADGALELPEVDEDFDGPPAKTSDVPPEEVEKEAPAVVTSAPPAPVAPLVPTAAERAATFAERFEGTPTKDLRRRANELHGELDALAVELFRKRYDAGRFEIHPYRYDANGRTLPARSSTPETPAGLASRVFEDERAREWHYVVLPRDEYPDYYRDFDELGWIRRRFEELEGDG